MPMPNEPLRPIWLDADRKTIHVIDQRRLPHEFVVAQLGTPEDVCRAIAEMYVRGAPLIGVAGAYGVYLAALQAAGADYFDLDGLQAAADRLKSSRPTAVNLAWAVDRVMARVLNASAGADPAAVAREAAAGVADLEIQNCRRIGLHGAVLIEDISRAKGEGVVNILTHCNAGWLACVAYGTATAPIYRAHENGIKVHVWVDETRPLNQGARLTAWELGRGGVPHTVIADNAGGHLMQHGRVDMVIVGTDRATYTGDVANKIGTYLKALAAKDNGVPFYVALPSSTFDWTLADGVAEIPIEARDPAEIRYVQGLYQGKTVSVLVPPDASPACNYAFDVTPARLVTGFITEKGLCRAEAADILRLFPEKGR